MAASPENSDRVETSKRVERAKAQILRQWEKRARETVPAAREQSRLALRDSLPKFIDHLVQTLCCEDPKTQAEINSEVACEHAEDRAVQIDYTLDQVIYEYHLMRTVLIECVETDGPVDARSRSIIHEFIDRGIRKSAVRYHELETTKHLESQTIIRESEERFRQLAENLVSQVVHVMELHPYRVSYVSPSYEAIWQKSLASLYENPRSSIDRVHPDDRPKILAAIAEQDLGKTTRIEYRLLFEDGSLRWIHDRSFPVQNAEGKVYRATGIAEDITERKFTEGRLAFERHQLETLFRLSPAAMVLWRGPDFIFERVNPEYQAIFPGRELLGKPLLEALPELVGQPFKALLTQVYETGVAHTSREMLTRLAREAGGPLEDRYYDFTYIPVTDGDGKPYGVYDHAIDVTERVLDRKALEESKLKLESTVRDLEKEQDLRDRFVATLTHDLRTPLTAARMCAQLMPRKLSDPEGATKLASRIVHNIDRADQMIRDLLDASLIKAGESLPIEISRCDLSQIAKDTLADLSTVHGERFTLSADAHTEGYWSATGLRRILENLCNNAVKYGAAAKPVTVSLAATPQIATIRVHNEGSPIPAADQARIFEPFRRTESAQSGGQRGWGLGLSLVKGIAEAHGGKVWIESTYRHGLGDGTTFVVELPRESRAQ